jgi:hypothetical protein
MPPLGHFSLIRFLKEGGAERADRSAGTIPSARAAS